MKLNILIGGAAGAGPNILTHILAETLVEQGLYVFYSRDYQSLIRGGHNFNVLTLSNEEVYSNDSEIDILIALDESTKKIHEKELKKNGIILEGKYSNMFFAGRIFKVLGLDFGLLEKQLKKISRFKENLEEAQKGYNSEEQNIDLPEVEIRKKTFMNGSQGIAEGAIKSGLDIYYGYPMTPATPLLVELASKESVLSIELENEIAVVNAGVGSSIVGKKVMVGTSGGGFDLMTEGLSLCGMAEVPLVFYLAIRPGPSTGVATYTSQGDLKMALNAGHGEFNRVVLAPGEPKEAQELVSQAFYFSQKYKTPTIIISDKHLAESFYTINEEAKITKSEKTTKLARYNSYEKDEFGSATENAEIIKKNVEKRLEKKKQIEKEAEKFEMYKFYGAKESENIIISWGSTKGAILDAIKNSEIEAISDPQSSKNKQELRGLDVNFIQILYLEPFPNEIKKYLENKNAVLVENDSTGQLADVIREKTGVEIKEENKILRYDGRPFLADELKREIERRMK